MDYYQHFLQSIPGPSPCGEDLEYDPDFILLQSRLQPRLEAEYGQFTEAAIPLNWADIERDCHALMGKSRDIRLLITLIRCRLRVIGFAALAEGFTALYTLLQQWPDTLYPPLYDDGVYDPLMRANALSELCDHSGLLSDLRSSPLPRAAGIQCMVKDVERALATPRDESALTKATVEAMQRAWFDDNDSEIASLFDAGHQLQMLSDLLKDSLGEHAPDFSSFLHLLTLFVRSANIPAAPHRDLALTASENTFEPLLPSACTVIIEQPSPPPQITNRTSAFSLLKEVQAWFTHTEPGSPVVLLLDVAIKTSEKNFTELLQLLPADIVVHLNQVGKE